MNSPAEYLFGPHIALAKAFARKQGWREYGRAAWKKRDGRVVYFLSLLVQLEIVSRGVVRRARLFYLRSLAGKAARVRDAKDG